MIKFFADTASLEEIEYCFSREVNDGITTNPKIIEATGNLSLGFEAACKSILEKYPNVPVSLETDLRSIDVKKLSYVEPEKVKNILLQQAYQLASFGKNVVIKIPICEAGLLAAKELREKGIKTNITACMTPYQALRAAQVGFGYVSLFANRMLDAHILELARHSLEEILTNPNWKNIVQENKEFFLEKAWQRTLNQIVYVAEELDNNENCSLIVGSIREPKDIQRLAEAKPQIITIPTNIVKCLDNIKALKNKQRTFRASLNDVLMGNSLYHPMTQYTLEEFEKAADSYRK